MRRVAPCADNVSSNLRPPETIWGASFFSRRIQESGGAEAGVPTGYEPSGFAKRMSAREGNRDNPDSKTYFVGLSE